MRLIEDVQQLPNPPRACAVTNRATGDFIDLQVIIDRPEPTRLYLFREIAEEAGRLCGMVPASEVEEMKAQMAELSQKLDHLNDILNHQAEFEQLLGAGKD